MTTSHLRRVASVSVMALFVAVGLVLGLLGSLVNAEMNGHITFN